MYFKRRELRARKASEQDNIVIASRTYGGELYHIAMSFIDLPYKKLAFTQTASDEYMYKLLKLNADWVINIDEDAFVLSNRELVNLLHFMQDNEYDFCGMSDSGPMRGANPIAMNPYFNIFNMGKIRKSFHFYKNLYPHLILKSLYLALVPARRTMMQQILISALGHRKLPLSYILMSQISSCTFNGKPKQFIPSNLMCDWRRFLDYEPYYPFFYWLLKEGFRPLYLDAQIWEDNMSVMLHSYDNRPLLIHCWLAREWSLQKERFNRVIDYCRSTQS